MSGLRPRRSSRSKVDKIAQIIASIRTVLPHSEELARHTRAILESMTAQIAVICFDSCARGVGPWLPC